MKSLSVLIFLSMVCSSMSNTFDFEELKKTNYGLDIMDQPVVFSKTDDNSLIVTSIHGQQYHCNYPDSSNAKQMAKEEEQEAIDVGISDLLKPMAEGDCLFHTKGWWTYEFCFGKEIKQYHMKDNEVVGEVTSLGKYGSEFDWTDDSQENELKRHKLNRFHSQSYVNGSICDLTKKTRSTEVKFQCDPHMGDKIIRIDEPQTCSYVITVMTMKLCHHPYFKPPTPKLPTPISCNPVLTQQEFDEYLSDVKQKEEEEARLKEESLQRSTEDYMKRLKARHEAEEFVLKDGRLVEVSREQKSKPISKSMKSEISGESDWDDMDLTDESKLTKELQDLDRAFTDALTQTMRDIFGDENVEDAKVKFKVLKNTDDMKGILKEMAEETHDESELDTTDGDEIDDELDASADHDGEIDDDEGSVIVDDEDEDQEDSYINEKDYPPDKSETKTAPASSITEQGAEDKPSSHSNVESSSKNVFKSKSFEKIAALAEKYVSELSTKQLRNSIKKTEALMKENQDKLKEYDDIQKEDNQEKLSKKSPSSKIENLDDDMDLEQYEKEFMKEYNKEIEKLAPKKEDKERLSKYADAVKKTLTSTFDEIVAEAKEELGDEYDESLETAIDKQQTEEEITSTVNKLMEKLKKANQELDEATTKLKSVQSKANSLSSTSMKKSEGRKMNVFIKAGFYDEEEETIHFFNANDNEGVSNVVYAIIGENPNQRKEEERVENMEKGYSFKFSASKDKRQQEQTDDES